MKRVQSKSKANFLFFFFTKRAMSIKFERNGKSETKKGKNLKMIISIATTSSNWNWYSHRHSDKRRTKQSFCFLLFRVFTISLRHGYSIISPLIAGFEPKLQNHLLLQVEWLLNNASMHFDEFKKKVMLVQKRS